jgi:hypothetical protein
VAFSGLERSLSSLTFSPLGHPSRFDKDVLDLKRFATVNFAFLIDFMNILNRKNKCEKGWKSGRVGSGSRRAMGTEGWMVGWGEILVLLQ